MDEQLPSELTEYEAGYSCYWKGIPCDITMSNVWQAGWNDAQADDAMTDLNWDE